MDVWCLLVFRAGAPPSCRLFRSVACAPCLILFMFAALASLLLC